jgi:predicted amidohydrolase YtcJ
LGITMVHDMDGAIALRAEPVLRERGQLSARVLKSVPLDLLDEAIALGIRTGLGDDWLRIGQVKMFADGALGPRTAWMLAGYASAPEDCGIATTPATVLADAVQKANASGLGCAIHAIGDRACRQVLDIYESVGRNDSLRNRVEHAQILHPTDQERFARLGVIASMQPIHATSDMDISDRHLGERAARAYVFRQLYDSGAHLAFGSDCPVEGIDPRVGIHAAVTRRRVNGQPGPQGWRGDQRLSVRQALEGFTVGPAYAAGMEAHLGALAPGKLGDAVILGADLLAVDPMEIPNVPILGTVVGGQFVWRDSDLG